MRIWVVGLAALGILGCDRLLGEAPPGAPPSAAASEEIVAVDWLGRGVLYAARVVDRRGVLTRVRYADGEQEWVEADRLRPWPDLSGRGVQFYSGARAYDVTVSEMRDGLLHVEFPEGGDTWISTDMLYRLAPAQPSAPRTPTPSGPAPSFPARAAADPSRVVVGAPVLAYWISDGALDRSRPWRARVASRSGDTVHLAYADGSEADLPASAVLRVFEPSARAEIGGRYWLADAGPPVGVVLERRGELTKIRVGTEERWLEDFSALEPAPLLSSAALNPGAFVTALWNGNALYHATVVSTQGDQVTLAWHDGSEPSRVPVADVLEVWSAAP